MSTAARSSARARRRSRHHAFPGQRGILLLTLRKQAGSLLDASRAGRRHLALGTPAAEGVRDAEARSREHGAPSADGAASGGILVRDPGGARPGSRAASGAAGAPAPVPSAPARGFL
ncbi:VOC family protein [Streptomyces sp. C10-9-1]|uniref:VOC family protein n=1 Tax=Streptomyces sp. C10-9-1 TaxID=1859285 RepID=UPI002111170A|nr:VOC family protein [Streptomyces sp. C10-9-1]MCQ6552924.1 VOC family protein [Streptomyces sp. C10-9-1]